MEELFTVEQTAQYLKCDVRTVYDYIHNKELRAAKIGRAWKIRQSDIAQFIEDCIVLQMGDVRKTPFDDDSLSEEKYQKAVKEGDTITQPDIDRSRNNRDLKKKTRFMADFENVDEAYPQKEF